MNIVVHNSTYEASCFAQNTRTDRCPSGLFLLCPLLQLNQQVWPRTREPVVAARNRSAVSTTASTSQEQGNWWQLRISPPPSGSKREALINHLLYCWNSCPFVNGWSSTITSLLWKWAFYWVVITIWRYADYHGNSNRRWEFWVQDCAFTGTWTRYQAWCLYSTVAYLNSGLQNNETLFQWVTPYELTQGRYSEFTSQSLLGVKSRDSDDRHAFNQ